MIHLSVVFPTLVTWTIQRKSIDTAGKKASKLINVPCLRVICKEQALQICEILLLMFILPNVCKILRLCHIFAHFQRITLDLGKLTEVKAHFSAGLMNFRLVIYVESYKAKVEG